MIKSTQRLILILSVVCGVSLGILIGYLCIPNKKFVYYEFDCSSDFETKEHRYKELPSEMSDYICDLCEQLDEDSDLCVAELLQENPTLDANAIHKNLNGTLDVGLWQMNDRYLWSTFIPRYWNLDVEFDPFNWKMETFLAIHHIHYLHTTLKTLDDTIMAYNCGEGAVMNQQIPESTKAYLASVTRTYNFLKEESKDNLK